MMRFKTFVELTRKPKIDRFKGSLRKALMAPNELQGSEEPVKTSNDEVQDKPIDKLLN